MSPDAKRRMEIYQEGQRAFNRGTKCPYKADDWRSGPWAKGWVATQAHHASLRAPPSAPPQAMTSAGWTIRRSGDLIVIESFSGDSSTLSWYEHGDTFSYFHDLLKENNL